MRCLITKLRRFQYYDDLAKACRENGVDVASEFCDQIEDARNLFESVDRFRPDFILNHPVFSLIVSRVGAMRGIPVLHWLADKFLNQEHFNPEIYTDTDFILPTCREDAGKLSHMGVKASYLINACNIQQLDYNFEDKKYGVCFVGTIELGSNNYYRQFIEALYKEFCQKSSFHAAIFTKLQNTFDDILRQQEEASRQFRYILPELVAKAYETIGPILRESNIQPGELTSILAKETTVHQRRHFLQAIPHLDVFGPEDWTQAHFPNVHYRGVADQFRESGHHFAASRINLAMTRVYALDGLSDRIFNVLRARGFLLASRQATLCEVFKEGIDLEMYTTVEELLDKIRFYEENTQAREKIARQGYENVIHNHTFANRIREMLPLLSR
ncbi:MAG: glycosyltransferase family 1 protein [Magnetococcales bacterium]|nr:glycosyltransferase family 1 protein [Magnetococcales bacterium]MBF0322717.1 glycosyltransferase family 1 protein [Magnetococcales bacterium]